MPIMKHQSALESGISMELCSFISSLLLILQRKFFLKKKKKVKPLKCTFIASLLCLQFYIDINSKLYYGRINTVRILPPYSGCRRVYTFELGDRNPKLSQALTLSWSESEYFLWFSKELLKTLKLWTFE